MDDQQYNESTLSFLKGFGFFGALLTAFTIFKAMVDLQELAGIVRSLADKWAEWMHFGWNFVLKLFDFPEISTFDALFLTFFMLLFVSIMMAFRTRGARYKRNLTLPTRLSLFVGMILLVGLFTYGDVKIIEKMAADEVGSQTNTGIHAYFLSLYVYMVEPILIDFASSMEAESMNQKIYLTGFMFLFYFAIASLIMIASAIFVFLIGLKLDLRVIAQRVWLIVILVGVMILLNRGMLIFDSLSA